MHPSEIDKPLCNCGVVGVFGHPRAAFLTYSALHALQHRGQESAGIVASRASRTRAGERTFAVHKDHGLVLDIFEPTILESMLVGDRTIGHNRYSTTGNNVKRANIQPFHVSNHQGNIALAHNGNLTNTRVLREELSREGALFQTTTDSELILHLIVRSRAENELDRIGEALRTVRGAYSVTIMTDQALYAARDPHGFRPLAIGRLPGGGYMIASETCALDIVSAEYVRDVEPNEIVVIDEETLATGEIHSYRIDEITPKPAHCIFEYVYFSRPDSRIFGHSVDKVRRRLGKRLAEEAGMTRSEGHDRVVVISVPDSSNTATLGYSRINEEIHEARTRFEIGLIRSHYVGRTFIAPGQENRELKVKAKFNIVRGVLEGQQVVVVDDSIVRGTTSKALVNLIREASPDEIHLRITSPPITHPCLYGMDFPSREELIANQKGGDIGAIRNELGVDSLHYLSVEGLLDAVPHDDGEGYCTACFTGNYPVAIDTETSKFVLENS